MTDKLTASSSLEDQQRVVCEKFGVDFDPPRQQSKVGMSRDARSDIQPLNGLRHPPQGDSNGWYIWRGTALSDADGYFQPFHVEHVVEECPEALNLLALPPGWRFLIAPSQVDA